jgi:prephenate dehydrogenase
MSFAMWRDILRANAHNVEPELRRLSVELLAAADALAEGKTSELERLFPALQAS